MISAQIPAHRVVLAARCEYFRVMFASGMREATQQQARADRIGMGGVDWSTAGR